MNDDADRAAAPGAPIDGDVPASAPWLAGVPSLPDRLSALAAEADESQDQLDPLDELFLDWHVRQVASLIRAARERYERLHGILILP